MSYVVGRRVPVAFWGFGADAPAGDADPFFTFQDGVRYWNESSRKAMLDAMGTMSIQPQIPAVDDRGIRLILTPGETAGILSTKDAVIAMARSGYTVLALDAFQANIDQVIRLVQDLSFLPGLTDPEQKGNYAVLLTPAQAGSLAPWVPTAAQPPPPVMPPPTPVAVVPPAPPPAKPAATPTQASVAKLGEFVKKPAVWITGLVLLGVFAMKGK
jgi:hypothetical protein